MSEAHQARQIAFESWTCRRMRRAMLYCASISSWTATGRSDGRQVSSGLEGAECCT